MQFHKKNKENNISNEKDKMIESIQSDDINNVCFECGTNDPEYISINNAVFICKECVQDHFDFPHEISQIIINDLPSLSNNELKKLYLGGNKNLIEFINFDFPRLKQFPPNILYKTRAVDYYRKRLQFFVQGGIRPLKPILEYAYQMVNIPKNNINYRKDIYLSPTVNIPNERISTTTKLTPISEGNQLDDEINCSSNSDNKNNDNENNEIQQKFLTPDNNKSKDDNNHFIYSPKKPKHRNNNNNNISFNSSNFNKSFDNHSNSNKDNEMNISPLINPYKKHIIHNFKNDNSNNDNKKDELNMNNNSYANKNISEITNLNNNEKSITNINDDNFIDDNTIKSINKYMNNSKESDSSLIKVNRETENNKIIKLVKQKKDEINNNIKENNEKEINKITKTPKIENKNKSYSELKFINNKNGKIKETNEKKYNNRIRDYKNEDDKFKDYLKKDIKNPEVINYNNKYNIFEKDSTKENKKLKVIIPNNLDISSEKGKTSKRKYLKANVSATQLINCYKDDNDNNDIFNDFSPYKSKKIYSLKDNFVVNELNKKIPFKKNEFLNNNKKENFYSNMSSSNFINPLKYLKRSFQKKQEEKFGYNSDESNSSNSKSYEEEKIINKNNLLKIISQPNFSKKNIKEIQNDNIKTNVLEKDNKQINQRIINLFEKEGKEGDTKESTESIHEDNKNVSIRQKYKNRRAHY